MVSPLYLHILAFTVQFRLTCLYIVEKYVMRLFNVCFAALLQGYGKI